MKKVAVTIPQQEWGTIKTKYPSDSLFVRLDELTGGSKNFDSTVKGILTKRPGGINYNPTTFSSPPKDQFEAIFTDGVHHLLIVEGGNLRFSSGGGTFSLVTAGYSTLGNFEFAVYQDRVYFGNGIDSPQVYDRTTPYGGVAYTVPQTKVMGAQAPSTAPTAPAAGAAGGAVPAGAHTYKVTFLYYDSEESNGSAASGVCTVVNPNNTVNLTAVPVGGYGVTARKIYRDDNDGVYRLVGTISNNTATTFSDTASTGTALIPTTNDVPPSFKYIQVHLDRTWIAGIPGDPSSLRFSEAGLPDIFPSANDILCNPEDPITALAVYDNKVWVFNRNSIGRILGRTRDTFQYAELPGSVGCVDNRSIQVRTINGVPTLMWLSDKGIYGTNGSSVEYLSDPIEDLVNLNIQQATQVKGQNAQTSQIHFQAGTASPGIDLTSSPGTITTANPRRVWDDEADWEGASSQTNVATNSGNVIKVPVKHSPAFSAGTHNNTVEASNTLRTPQATNNDGVSSSIFFYSTIASNGNYTKLGEKFTFPRGGTISSARAYVSTAHNIAQAAITVWADSGGLPGSVLFQGPFQDFGPTSNTLGVVASGAISVPVSAGQSIWIGATYAFGAGGLLGNGSASSSGTFNSNFFATYTGVVRSFNGTWSQPTTSGSGTQSTSVEYTFTHSPVATSGLWIGPTYDSLSDSAVAATIEHTGTFASGTASVTTVEASNNADMSSASTQSFNSLNGSTAVSLSNKRYWRIKIALSAGDDIATAAIGLPTLRFSTTGTWISEVIDHTTDITALNSLTAVTTVPSGTSVTLEISTSADNITYSAFTALGSAVAQRYSKVRITMTATSDDVTTPTVTSARLTWTLVSNLISSVIDTGSTPAGWDVFQAQFATNGGTVVFHMRTAATSGGLGAATFVTVTNGSFPTNTPLQFVQWRATLTSTADTVPTVDSVTVNWFIALVSSIRVASLFFNRSYYLAAAEFNQTTNNIVLVFDGEGKWRTYRGVTINTFSLFFNDPYYGSSVEGRIVRFLSGATDQGSAIEMVAETKAIDFGDMEHNKVGRKVYLKGKNTGAVYSVFMSFDEGTTYNQMIDADTGLSTFTSSSSGSRFRRRFQLNFELGQATAGKTVKIKVVENTTASAEIDEIKLEAWIRQGELVN